MIRKNSKKENKKTASKKSGSDKQSHEFETMSQKQNRYGGGRERSGSDGSNPSGRGSNH
jgi:hypothetical protein